MSFRSRYYGNIVGTKDDDGLTLLVKAADLTQNLPKKETPLTKVEEKPHLVTKYLSDFAYALFPMFSKFKEESLQGDLHGYLSEIAVSTLQKIACDPAPFSCPDKLPFIKLDSVIERLEPNLKLTSKKLRKDFDKSKDRILGKLRGN